ncbi:MAG: transglutaminase domain-containing protein [Candidatus Zixiibacteriota bacterium]|nr:MAG: transglutaminase domain-containing protein [candidate division Zixibacteria bacterium]
MREPKLTTFTFILIVSLIAGLAGLSCGGAGGYPPEVESVLSAAGENRGELERFIRHYEQEGDSLKLKAALYLVANIEGHSYVTYYLHDSAGTEVDFNVLDYPDYKSLTAAADSIEDIRGEMDYEKKETFEDIHAITADFLIGQTDLAFRAWRERPWAGFLSFDQFCQYVLPYRGSNEPLENWREEFWTKYQDLPSRMNDPSDPVEAARLINEDIRSWFGFDPRYYYHPTDQGLAEMLESGLGRCEDMTNVTIYAMRANGLAVTSDYTPYWADAGNNHAWNAILTPDGKVVPFMGAEADPGSYDLSHGAAKIYRKTYSQQPGNLVFQERKQDSIPRWLKGKSYLDVTSDYMATANVTVPLAGPVPDSIDIAYICVFNSGEWKPIDWARITDNTAATFEDIGTGIAYLPALYENEEIAPAGPPFIISDDGDKHELLADPASTCTAELVSTTARTQQASSEGIKTTLLKPGVVYELFYWDNGWESLGKITATNKPISFESVPIGALYWLVADGSDREERIFTLQQQEQMWW